MSTRATLLARLRRTSLRMFYGLLAGRGIGNTPFHSIQTVGGNGPKATPALVRHCWHGFAVRDLQTFCVPSTSHPSGIVNVANHAVYKRNSARCSCALTHCWLPFGV